MVEILLAVKNKLFRQSLKLFLENEGIAIVKQADNADAAIILETLPEIVITEFSGKSYGCCRLFEDIIEKFPTVKFLVISNKLNMEEYLSLINAGVKGSVLNTTDLSELVVAINEVTSGKIFFPQQVLQKIMLSHPSGADKNTNALTEREIGILRLLCEGLSNEQISEKIHLSYDTVKWHRSNILVKCGCKNILSLYKYAVTKELV